jgi:hypothetical protein
LEKRRVRGFRVDHVEKLQAPHRTIGL